MAKLKKTRSYKVQGSLGVPCLTIKGKFLQSEFGIEVGTRLELIEGENLLVLCKIPEADTQYQEDLERLKVAEKEATELRSKVQAFERRVSSC